MILTPEQVAAAQKANLETLFGLTTKAFEGVEKLVELNLQVVKATFAENVDNAKKALSAKDAQELLAIQASLVQPVAEKTLAYSRHLYEIASETQSEFTKVAEAQLAEGTKNVQALVENFAKNAPGRFGIDRRHREVGHLGRQQCVRVGPEGHEASRGNGRNQLPGCRHRRNQGCPASLGHGPHGYQEAGCHRLSGSALARPAHQLRPLRRVGKNPAPLMKGPGFFVPMV